MPVSPPIERLAASCRHCGSPVPEGSPLTDFCCAGCEAVHRLLVDQGLTRYYSLADGRAAPAPEPRRDRGFAWLEPLIIRAEASTGSVCALELDVQGIHCAACVWLMNELFCRHPGGASLTVNPALGKVRLAWRKGAFDVAGFLRSVEGFGYLFGPSRKHSESASHDLPIRLGICAAITMNVMLFSVSFYVGLTPADGEVFSLFSQLSVWLSTGVVLVGGWPFFRSAWRGLRSGVLHLDLPIALGILLVFSTSLLKARDGRGDLAYFDTLNTFVTLMLVGRWLQQRVLERNRRFLLEDDGAEGLFARRQEGDRLVTVRAAELRSGDVLVIAPGELVPVDAELLDARASFSTDWVTGEPDVRAVERGGEVPAGAFNAARAAAHLRARTDFQDSPLVALLRQTPSAASRVPAHARFWNSVSRRWVLSVLFVSVLGLVLWLPRGHDKALQVAVALLVVTCPCAIGIAVPLAYELTQTRLRRLGLFVRGQDLLDRLPRVRKVLFDKTGTLTLGRLELVDREAVEALAPEVRDVAFDMAARSNHPVSRCLAAALSRTGARFSSGAQVTEHPGQGLELLREEGTWRLGAPVWAAPGARGLEGTVLTLNGQPLATFALRESVRADARREIQALSEAGHEVWLISGDAPERVRAMAEALAVPVEHALGGQRPEDKAEVVARIDQSDTLYLGDGVNDSLAFERAFCAGTPAIDRPVLPGKSDFFLMGEGLSAIREALELSRRLRQVVHRLLGLALAYNVVTVSVSLAGLMTPLRAAVVMPLSSLSLILFTLASLSARRQSLAGGEPRALKEVPA
ncbi:heavy metal translocating P-type ATPase metal-binding domain-containing protein [Vitiosangium sp. GDMCC 1.1324]|uniref:heavy metal translocating P-type ATPase n=1 Tax=Vitiosangium sp. (strain GDMCC 1.1324) TaxID=2138576 RepID=UPI000D3BB523|nr:heavy metal translocating P-type ATPase metal-binding domain-containing protein [Vitiosangium sp. GDMCC 1.1324]PTL77570.1 ATPase P [Vitiosangium sp. GDMCC 1.1324]